MTCDEDVNDSPESTRAVECGEPAARFWLEDDGSPAAARCALHPVGAWSAILARGREVDRATYEAALVMCC